MRERTVYIDNRVHQGTVGYLIASPLRLAGSDRYVLVERGWVAAGPDRKTLPTVVTPPGEVEIKGIATPANPPRVRAVAAGAGGQPVAELDGGSLPPAFRHRSAADHHPAAQRAAGRSGARLAAARSLGIERHRGYALQWFAMALAILILYVVLNVRRTPRVSARPNHPAAGRRGRHLAAACGLRPVLLLATELVHQLRGAPDPHVARGHERAASRRLAFRLRALQGQVGDADGRFRSAATHSVRASCTECARCD